MVGKLLERADGGAIALGGGSVISERVREALARHIVVWLQVDAREAWQRIGRSDRPLASNAGTSSACSSSGDRSTEPWPMRSSRRRPRPDLPRDAVADGAHRAAGRDGDALGRQRLRRVPGLRRSRSPGHRRLAADRRALLRHRWVRRPALRRSARAAGGRIDVPPGETAKTMAEAERCCASWTAWG